MNLSTYILTSHLKAHIQPRLLDIYKLQHPLRQMLLMNVSAKLQNVSLVFLQHPPVATKARVNFLMVEPAFSAVQTRSDFLFQKYVAPEQNMVSNYVLLQTYIKCIKSI